MGFSLIPTQRPGGAFLHAPQKGITEHGFMVGGKIGVWVRPGFDVGAESARGMPSTSSLVNPLETK